MRRAGGIVVAGVVALVAVAGVLLFFQSRDESTITASEPLGEPYTGEPVLSPALEDAVARGNVVVLHRDVRPPAGARDLQAGAGPALAREGLAVLLEPEPTLRRPLAAVGAGRIQYGDSAEDLQEFIELNLGRRPG